MLLATVLVVVSEDSTVDTYLQGSADFQASSSWVKRILTPLWEVPLEVRNPASQEEALVAAFVNGDLCNTGDIQLDYSGGSPGFKFDGYHYGHDRF